MIMKKSKIILMAAAAGFVVLLSSCGPSRETSYYHPRPSASVSLIIDGGPGIYATRYRDGRYYYRSPDGYTYWRGYDNRYYLDRSYVGRNNYRGRDYDDWH